MILKKMKLSNFRQFKGPQEIVFSNKEDGKVTVIFGENGRGKTGIYRALLFCLYGETRLSQDAKVNDKEFYLVNYPEMEANSEDNNPVEAYVELEFTHANRTYKLLRSILGMIDSGEVIQEEKGARLVSVDEDGNSNSTRDPNDINDM